MSFFCPFDYINTTNIKNALTHLHTFGFFSMVRKIRDYIHLTRDYTTWRVSHAPSPQQLQEQRQHIFSLQPKISIIVPVYKTPALFLQQMIDSVVTQTYPNWELCIADGSADPSATYISNIISKYQQKYDNIRYTVLSENMGISGNTNAALNIASGDYVALLDHDDILAPDALYEIADAINRNPDIDIIYTDEDKVDTELITYYDPYFKPDFNLDLLRSCNYITHFFIAKKQLVDTVGGFSIECNGSQDYDFILKTCELAHCIKHIPKILYHWRIHPDSVAGDPESKTYAYDAAVRALQNHLERTHEQGQVSKDTHFGYYRISYSVPENPLISICLIECAPNLREQIQNGCSYKNIQFADAPNDAMGEYIVMLYKVTKISDSNWIEQMLGNCSRSDVGLVSVKACFENNWILESGLIFTDDGRLHSPFYQYHQNDTGYCYQAAVQHNCSFVGPYCFMLKASVLRHFFPNGNEDNLYQNIYRICHTLTANGLSIVLIPYISVFCFKHRPYLPILEYCKGRRDPYYNPNFSDQHMYRLS